MNGQEDKDTREFSPEELEEIRKRPPSNPTELDEIEVEEVSLEDFLAEDKSIREDQDVIETQKLSRAVEKTQILPPGFYDKKPGDTEQHSTTITNGKKHDTTVFKFKDPRNSRAFLYKGFERLEWALTELVRKTNIEIDEHRIEAIRIKEGDIVQACVVGYFLDNENYSPETTPDSPKYATFPYEIFKEEKGFLNARIILPKETLQHFKIAQTVGEIIPNLTEEQKSRVKIYLQLKEVSHKPVDQIAKEIDEAKEISYKPKDFTKRADKETGEFLAFLGQDEQKTPVTPINKANYQPLLTDLSERISSNDQKDFGF